MRGIHAHVDLRDLRISPAGDLPGGIEVHVIPSVLGSLDGPWSPIVPDIVGGGSRVKAEVVRRRRDFDIRIGLQRRQRVRNVAW